MIKNFETVFYDHRGDEIHVKKSFAMPGRIQMSVVTAIMKSQHAQVTTAIHPVHHVERQQVSWTAGEN